jgi:UDP-glucose 4-epimerase
MGKANVLVVGGAGYIGSHMVKELLGAGFDVTTLDNLSTGHRQSVTGGTFVQGDLSDQKLLDDLFSEKAVDAVMHFAAYSLVGDSVKNPIDYYRNNFCGTLSLVDAMLRNGVRRFIFSSTAAVYGEPETVPIPETHPCVPTNPYGASKLAVERLLSDCDAAYGLKYMSLRYFNAAGADASAQIGENHERETHLIPLVLQTALGQRPRIDIFGTDYRTPDGTCLRDYVHVTDLASAHLLALSSLMDGSDSNIFNLGNSKGFSVREVIDLSRKITGKKIPEREAARREGDPAVLVAESEKIRRELGWQPRYEDLENIIESAWRWHQHQP